MDKTTQDLVWSVLPKEFKKKIKEGYKQLKSLDKESEFWVLEDLFGQINLISDVEEEEMLIVSRKEVMRNFNEKVALKNHHQSSTHDRDMATGWCNALRFLFGSKCLPDEEKSQPKFHKGDRVKVITDCWKDEVYTVTDVKEIYPQFSYMLSCSPTAWFTESTLEPYTEEPQPAEPKFMCGDKAVLKGYVCTIIGIVFGPQGKLVGYKIESSQIHGNMTVPESYLEPYTEPSNEESAVLRADSVKESRIADEESHLRNLSQEIAICDKSFDNILKDSPSKERRLNIAKDFVSVLLGRLNYDPFVAQINCCCSNGEAVNPYINIARIALSAADALKAET